ncbi:hypothetical protein F5888DRAFT_1910052 [Russula emetica]|nr:hypothetical protein F5888DRAFT_1910052 [Russula emetica]
MRGSSGTQHIFAKKINDDLLVEIFDFCRPDNISPNTYPRNWWYTFAHVCQRWRRVLFATPTRLGITLVCNSRTPVANMLANSPPLPLIIYWGNPGTLDTEDSVKNVLLALDHRDRVRRMTLHVSQSSLRKVFSLMKGPFPMLETLQLCSSSDGTQRTQPSAMTLPSTFEAPDLRHFQLSDLKLLPSSSQSLNDFTTRLSSIVTFSLGEITTKPAALMACLALMPHLKVLKVGVLFSIPSHTTEDAERKLCAGSEPKSALLALTDLEEFEYQGISDYLEALAARISAPFLKKLSITVTNEIGDRADLSTTTFKYLSRLISGAAGLAFQFGRVKFKDGFSIVMDHDELWTGRGAFELRFNNRTYYFDGNIGHVAKICRVLVPMPSTVQSLLLEDGHRNTWMPEPERKGWRELLRVFDNIKTLRVVGRFVEELDKALKQKDGDETLLLPRLQEIVRYGPENKFADYVKARQAAGSPVRVVSGPRNRLTLF